MGDAGKLALAFLGGAAAGAAALVLLNRGKLDFDYLKPLAGELLNRGMDIRDSLVEKMDALKEDLEELAAEAARRADAAKKKSETVAHTEMPDKEKAEAGKNLAPQDA